MMGTGMGWGSFGSFGWIGMILNIIITVGVIVGIVWFIIWLVRRAGFNGQGNFGPVSAEHSPREILQTRYASGEINREEYLEILADLS
jgi:putative membrane protein